MNVGQIINELKKYPEDLEVMFDIYATKDIHGEDHLEEVTIGKVFRGNGIFENIVFLEEVEEDG